MIDNELGSSSSDELQRSVRKNASRNLQERIEDRFRFLPWICLKFLSSNWKVFSFKINAMAFRMESVVNGHNGRAK